MPVQNVEFSAELGGNVDLVCRLNPGGVDDNNYIWQRESGRPIQMKAIQTGYMLRIPRVQQSDAGVYVCRNSQGRVQHVKLVIESESFSSFFHTPPFFSYQTRSEK